MARTIAALIALTLLGACTDPSTSTTPTTNGPTTTTTTSVISTTTVTTAPTSAPTSPAPILPAGIPPWFEDDVPSGDVPTAALIPLQTSVTNAWYAAADGREAIVVAWQGAGEDPFRVPRGIVAWSRFDDGGAPWRPVWGATFRPADRVLGIDATTGDVTGDGSDDLLVFASTGGTGTCGSYRLIDLATAEEIFSRPEVCDTSIDMNLAVPGLVVSEAVFAPGDPHCCPSQLRTTTLIYEGGSWIESDVSVTDL